MNLRFVSAIGDWIKGSVYETWGWFNQLNYQEWFLLLGIVAALGFLCMRGYGSRGNL